MIRGLFIVFEGLDGSGKTTQIVKIETYLKSLNLPVVRFYEPTHGIHGSKLRDLFKVGHVIPIQDEIELSIMDRSEDVKNNILPALIEGKIVLLDRYYWSNVAYQGLVDPNYSMEYILDKSRGFPEPDVIIYFDINVDNTIKRISTKRKPNEYESFNELTKSKELYDKLIKNMPKSFSGQFVSINAELDEEEVFKQIKHSIVKFIEIWKEK